MHHSRPTSTMSTSSHTKQVPGSSPEEVTLDEEVIILQNMLHVRWVVDDNTRRQRWNRDLVAIESNLPLTLDKPFEELMSGL